MDRLRMGARSLLLWRSIWANWLLMAWHTWGQ